MKKLRTQGHPPTEPKKLPKTKKNKKIVQNKKEPSKTENVFC